MNYLTNFQKDIYIYSEEKKFTLHRIEGCIIPNVNESIPSGQGDVVTESVLKTFEHLEHIHLILDGTIYTTLFFEQDLIIATSHYYLKIYSHKELSPELLDIIDSIKPNIKITTTAPKYCYITESNYGFDSNYFTLKENFNINIEQNYNSDLPYQELIDFCNQANCGLSLLYGSPGTGKTTLIKNLMNTSNNMFNLLDASILSAITSSKFLSYLFSKRGEIFVIEDCEKLLIDRNTNNNPWIGTLLNLTDGILGEGLGIKFICTFNADISGIDKALLREGRLKVCYEFKPLELNKAKLLNKDCTKPMTLAEIYKSKTDVSERTKKTKKIGF